MILKMKFSPPISNRFRFLPWRHLPGFFFVPLNFSGVGISLSHKLELNKKRDSCGIIELEIQKNLLKFSQHLIFLNFKHWINVHISIKICNVRIVRQHLFIIKNTATKSQIALACTYYAFWWWHWYIAAPILLYILTKYSIDKCYAPTTYSWWWT